MSVIPSLQGNKSRLPEFPEAVRLFGRSISLPPVLHRVDNLRYYSPVLLTQY
jgi:hypothetical protein